MSELGKSVKTYGLQAEVRRLMQHGRSFLVEPELPKSFRDKLAELDRAAASQTNTSL